MKEIEHDDKWLEDTEAGGTESIDPLSPEYAPGLNLIVLMRIYEVQLAILRESNPEAARRLLELHEQGLISTPLPYVDADQWNS